MRIALLSAQMLMLFLCSYSTEPLKNSVSFGELSPLSLGEIIEHTYYKLAYSEKNEQAFWVYYMLTPNQLNSSIDRTDDFRSDPKVKTGSATPGDYEASGSDRGHLCPAADMKLNAISISESFYMSNMSPQKPSFNRGIWNKLESQVREWAKTEDTIFIATGPVFRDNLGAIGANRVTIPGYYYKVILDLTGKMKMIALVLKNAADSKPLESYVVSVDSVEALTGIDFFAGLPNEMESKLESHSDIGLWHFASAQSKSTFHHQNGNEVTSPQKSMSTKQCSGIAKSTGKRCRSITNNNNGYCGDHQKQAPK